MQRGRGNVPGCSGSLRNNMKAFDNIGDKDEYSMIPTLDRQFLKGDKYLKVSASLERTSVRVVEKEL